MRKRRKRRLASTINWLIKGTIGALLLLAIYRQAFDKEGLPLIRQAVEALPWMDNWPWLSVALMLLPINWLLETEKWRRLLLPFWAAPFRQAFLAVMAGVSLSLFTPSRAGEYGGRVLAVPAAHNWHAVMAMAVGSVAQLLVLLGGGLAGVMYLARHYYGELQLWFDGLCWLAVGLWCMAVILFFNIAWLAGPVRKFPLPRKVLHLLLLLRRYRRRQLALALALAAARYAAYSFQYFCLLSFFGVGIPPGAALAGIATIFLIQTGIPLPPALGLLARGEVALLALGGSGADSLAILAAAFALFIINLCLPALLGMAVIVRINVLNSLGYDVIQNEPDRHYTDTSHGFRYPRKD